MSEKMTKIKLRNNPKIGLMDYGEKTVPEMIEQIRSYAAHLRTEADAISEAADSDFIVTVVRGSLVQHHVKTLQP